MMNRLGLCQLLKRALSKWARGAPLGAATVFALSSIALAPCAVAGSCDESLKSALEKDKAAHLLTVKAFAKGERLNLDGSQNGPIASDDLCMVKLIVGPGNPGPTSAASTSEGIGIEVWLPSSARWNGRIHAMGGDGFGGMPEITSPRQVGIAGNGTTAAEVADKEGSVSALTDGGHVVPGADLATATADGSFAMNPDGSIDGPLWGDFSSRAVHELAEKTKALATAFYGHAAKHAYFEGCSNGGREGIEAAQAYPEDFDGILAGDAPVDWTSVMTGDLYPQVVMQRDLDGKPLTPQQLLLVSSAAVSACDSDLNGEHAGYVSDPEACRYDPTRDRSVLCQADGGTNSSPACLSARQALAINKIWYGQTTDGSVPDPAKANGYTEIFGPKQFWFGVTRGTALANPPSTLGVANSVDGVPAPFPIATIQVALNLQNPKLAIPTLQNQTGNGSDGWKSLSYAELVRAHREGQGLQPKFGHVNSSGTGYLRFKANGGKLLYYHGMADQVIPIQGLMRYYLALAKDNGGFAPVQYFFQFYPIPGMGHCSVSGAGSVDGIAGVSPPADPPLPAPNQMFDSLVGWVEGGHAPHDLIVHNSKGTVSRPLCIYPSKLKYRRGDRAEAGSYVCQ